MSQAAPITPSENNYSCWREFIRPYQEFSRWLDCLIDKVVAFIKKCFFYLFPCCFCEANTTSPPTPPPRKVSPAPSIVTASSDSGWTSSETDFEDLIADLAEGRMSRQKDLFAMPEGKHGRRPSVIDIHQFMLLRDAMQYIEATLAEQAENETPLQHPLAARSLDSLTAPKRVRRVRRIKARKSHPIGIHHLSAPENNDVYIQLIVLISLLPITSRKNITEVKHAFNNLPIRIQLMVITKYLDEHTKSDTQTFDDLFRNPRLIAYLRLCLSELGYASFRVRKTVQGFFTGAELADVEERLSETIIEMLTPLDGIVTRGHRAWIEEQLFDVPENIHKLLHTATGGEGRAAETLLSFFKLRYLIYLILQPERNIPEITAIFKSLFPANQSDLTMEYMLSHEEWDSNDLEAMFRDDVFSDLIRVLLDRLG